jgi:hypothetical protein
VDITSYALLISLNFCSAPGSLTHQPFPCATLASGVLSSENFHKYG